VPDCYHDNSGSDPIHSGIVLITKILLEHLADAIQTLFSHQSIRQISITSDLPHSIKLLNNGIEFVKKQLDKQIRVQARIEDERDLEESRKKKRKASSSPP
jgi:hypothetical protein